MKVYVPLDKLAEIDTTVVAPSPQVAAGSWSLFFHHCEEPHIVIGKWQGNRIPTAAVTVIVVRACIILLALVIGVAMAAGISSQSTSSLTSFSHSNQVDKVRHFSMLRTFERITELLYAITSYFATTNGSSS